MTATTHTDIRPLSCEQIDAVAGAFGSFGTAFKISPVPQVIPTDPVARPTKVRDSHDRYANTERHVDW
jgi:hypothetical protein